MLVNLWINWATSSQNIITCRNSKWWKYFGEIAQFEDIAVQKHNISIMSRFKTSTFDTCRVLESQQLMSLFTTTTLMKCRVSGTATFDSMLQFKIITFSRRPFWETSRHLIKQLDSSQNDKIVLAPLRFWVIFVF
jgi:hypothetical protein